MGRNEQLLFLPLFIDQLEPEEQFFVNARYYERLSIAVIAKELGIEDGEVLSIERRAMKRLRAMVNALPEMDDDADI